MEFFFDEPKAAQAACVLLDRHGGPMPYIKLVKLLYLADRESLIETGSPITGDRFISMKYGPVLSRVLDLIKESEPAEDSIWHGYVLRAGYDAVLSTAAESDRLSEYEEGVLGRIFESQGREKEWDVVTRTHALPEWTDPGTHAVPIDPEAILRYAGYTDDEVQASACSAAAVLSLRTSLASAE